MISVIVPHLNQPQNLRACLQSLKEQSLRRDQYEVVVVDNGSIVPPKEIVADYPGVRLITELRAGPGPARNAGVASTSSEMIAFIDADCRAARDWLSTILRTLTQSPPNTILGGDVQIWHDERKMTAIEAYESVFAYRFELYIKRHGYSGTGNLAMFRADFIRVGPFGGIDIAEDMDWGRRARESGFRFQYVNDMIVYHPPRQTFRELCVKWDRHIQHAVNVGNRSLLWRFRWIGRSILVMISPIGDLVRVLRSDRIRGVSNRCKAALVLCAIRAHRAVRMLSSLKKSSSVAWNR